MTVQVHLFAAARDAVQSSQISLNLAPGATVADLRSALVQSFPALKGLQQSLLVAVNREYAADSFALGPSDEIACFPPVSGG
ncbi:MAG: MoaD/ThiS family protein [Planctomycetaceae bacterium]